jgi:hypothetical protein
MKGARQPLRHSHAYLGIALLFGLATLSAIGCADADLQAAIWTDASLCTAGSIGVCAR